MLISSFILRVMIKQLDTWYPVESAMWTKVLIHFLIQSCDLISCRRRPVEWANEIGPEMILLVHSTGSL